MEDIKGNADFEEMDEETRTFLMEEQEHMAGLDVPVSVTETKTEPQGTSGTSEAADIFQEHNAAATGTNPFGDDGDDDVELDLMAAMQKQSLNEEEGDRESEGEREGKGEGEREGEGLGGDSYQAIAFADVQMAEPEAVRKWREDQAVRLAEKDAHSAEMLAAMKEKAADDLATFYQNYHAQRATACETNRAAQTDVAAADPETGIDWTSVCEMCNFNPKTSKGLKDTNRMRGILLQLKQTPLPS